MDQFDTTLSSADETNFTLWFNQQKKEGRIPQGDQCQDYDFRGYYQETILKGEDQRNGEGHFPDRHKKPNHETFSNESKYAHDGSLNFLYAGQWQGGQYIPPLFRYPGE